MLFPAAAIVAVSDVSGTQPSAAGAPQVGLSLPDADSLFELAPGYRVRCIARLPQPIIMGLALGDVCGDGWPELITGTGPDSRLYFHRYDPVSKTFKTHLFAERLAGADCPNGVVSNILVADLNGNGTNEIVAMTDQEFEDSNMKFWIFFRDAAGWQKKMVAVPGMSHWTHGLAVHEDQREGMLDIFSVHCGHGEVFRYSFSRDLLGINLRIVKLMWAPGENLEIADVFNTGRKKLIVVQGDDFYNTAVKIYGFTSVGLTKWPEACIDSYQEKRFCDATTCTGDLDNDGKNEMVVGWAYPRSGAEITLVVYKFDTTGEVVDIIPLVEFSGDYGTGYLEARMRIGKIGSDSRNRLYVSRAEKGIYQFTLEPNGHKSVTHILRPKVRNFSTGRILLGDLDRDGRNELIFVGSVAFGEGQSEALVFLLNGGGDG